MTTVAELFVATGSVVSADTVAVLTAFRS